MIRRWICPLILALFVLAVPVCAAEAEVPFWDALREAGENAAGISGELWEDAAEISGELWEDAVGISGELWENASEVSGELWNQAGEWLGEKIFGETEEESAGGESELYYYYSRLGPEDRRVYRELYSGLMEGAESIRLRTSDPETVNRIVLLVLYDHPEIFWFEGASRYTVIAGRTVYRPDYICSAEERAEMEAEVQRAAEEALRVFSGAGSDYDRIRAVYSHVIETVDYDLQAPYNQMLTSALLQHRSVCSGYAKEVQYFLHQMGIPCLYVSGEIGEGGTHAWNIVQCSGRWYQLDATYGDPSFDRNAPSSDIPEELQISYSYLCCTDEELYRDHRPDVPEELPVCDSADLNDCYLRGTYYTEYPGRLEEDLRESLSSGEKCWKCQFAREEDYRSFLADLKDSLYLKLMGEVFGAGSYRAYWIYDEKMYTVGCWH